jgi:hypothetical protein
MIMHPDSPNSDQNYPAGSTTRVYIPVSVATHNDMVQALLDNSISQDGSLKAGAVDNTAVLADSIVTNDKMAVAVKPVTLMDETTFDFVASGCVWSGDAYGSTRNASMTAGVVYINGVRLTVSSVTARAFTASRDTYIDVDNTGTLVYTEVTNNNASPALAPNSIRIGIIVTGASNIANVGSVNQGEETKVLPIVSSIPYAVTDSLGNLICSRDPKRSTLGLRQIVANVTSTSTSYVDVTGLSTPVICDGLRKVKVSVRIGNVSSTQVGLNAVNLKFQMDGSDTAIFPGTQNVANENRARDHFYIATPSAGLHTFKVMMLQQSAGTITATAAATNPAQITVELA